MIFKEKHSSYHSYPYLAKVLNFKVKTDEKQMLEDTFIIASWILYQFY